MVVFKFKQILHILMVATILLGKSWRKGRERGAEACRRIIIVVVVVEVRENEAEDGFGRFREREREVGEELHEVGVGGGVEESDICVQYISK